MSTDSDNKALVAALEAAGHPRMAKHLADQELAEHLREAGHPEAADLVANPGAPPQQQTTAPAPARAAGAAPQTTEQDENERFVQQLKNASEAGWSSTPW